ncbi:GEVED domain-containing protein [Dyadobacter luticola]|uniref:T9SS type A sorting domain-containing protein n=1 Tax=Dyadobacter luticola TaxID=1979387 RepID=A0A5R9L4Y5_9BACT|nr:GEVED domain-containing protein [Dyadobacter luticola]TLV03340.1 T9SS type A sorting domain-containing protein [Dyadobacter luticola]
MSKTLLKWIALQCICLFTFSPSVALQKSASSEKVASETLVRSAASCTPTYTNSCSDFYGIDSFHINGLYLTSHSHCSPNGYGSFGNTTSVIPGETVNFGCELLGTTNAANIAVWIDANRNGIFEQDEKAFSNTSFTKVRISETMKIPMVSAGPLPIRVIAAYGVIADNQCGNYNYGETEDYVLTVQNDAINCIPTYINGCSKGDGLNNVSFDRSGTSSSDGCSPNGYGEFTFPYSVKVDTPIIISGDRESKSRKTGVSIWLDINRNGTFEGSERVYSTPELTTGPFAGTIRIPPFLGMGRIRARVISASGVVPMDPCGVYDYGETEDYSLRPYRDPSCEVSVSVSGPTILTCGSPTTVLTATTSSPNPTFKWSNGATGPSITVTRPYAYSVYMSSGSCTSVGSASISGDINPPTVKIKSSAPGLKCDLRSLTLTATASQTGATYLWNTGSTQRAITVTTPGTYSVTVAKNGCSGSVSYVVSGSADPATVQIEGSDLLTCSQPIATLIARTSAPNPQYRWSSNAFTAYINVVNAGSYTVTMTSGNCVATATKVVNSNISALNLNVSGDAQLSCSKPATTLTAATTSPNPTYLWSNGATTPSISVTKSGIYKVIMTSGGCTIEKSVQVTGSGTPPEVTVTGTYVLSCAKPSITITAQTDASNPTYQWNTGETTKSITVTLAGTYTATVVSSGCSGSASKTITGNGSPMTVNISGSSELTCQQPVVTLTATANTGSNTTYKWSNGTSGASIDLVNRGTYTVTATNGTCTATAKTIVTSSRPALNLSIGGDTLLSCSKTSVRLNAITTSPNPTYLWSNGATTASIDAMSPGLFKVTMTSGGCTKTASKNVTGNSMPPDVYVAGSSVLSCAKTNITMTALTHAPNATYLWNTGEKTKSIDVNIAGNYSVAVTSVGCTNTGSKTITGNGAPLAISISGPSELTCLLPEIRLSATAFPNATYKWSNGATTPAIDVSSPGSYSVTVTKGTCTATASKNVTLNKPAPNLIVTGDTVLSCSHTSLSLSAATTSPNPTYLWSNGATTESIEVTNAGTYKVTVNSGVCKTMMSRKIVGTPTPPDINITGSSVLSCAKTNITITAQSKAANPTYLWNTGETTKSIIVTKAGNYAVVVASADCYNVASKVITGSVKPVELNITGNHVLTCESPIVTLKVSETAGAAYKWSNGATTASIDVDAPGTYTVVKTQGACTATAAMTVTSTKPDLFLVINGETSLTCSRPTIALTAITLETDYSYKWNTGATTSLINITTPGNYQVTLTTPQGCTKTISKTITGGCNGNARLAADYDSAELEKVTLTAMVFPNPIQDKLVAEISGSHFNAINVRLLNSNGILMKELQLQSSSRKQKVSMDVNGFMPGIYLMEVISEENKVYQRVLIK